MYVVSSIARSASRDLGDREDAMMRIRVLDNKGCPRRVAEDGTRRQNLAHGVRKNATYDEAESQVPSPSQPTLPPPTTKFARLRSVVATRSSIMKRVNTFDSRAALARLETDDVKASGGRRDERHDNLGMGTGLNGRCVMSRQPSTDS